MSEFLQWNGFFTAGTERSYYFSSPLIFLYFYFFSDVVMNFLLRELFCFFSLCVGDSCKICSKIVRRVSSASLWPIVDNTAAHREFASPGWKLSFRKRCQNSFPSYWFWYFPPRLLRSLSSSLRLITAGSNETAGFPLFLITKRQAKKYEGHPQSVTHMDGVSLNNCGAPCKYGRLAAVMGTDWYLECVCETLLLLCKQMCSAAAKSTFRENSPKTPYPHTF